MWILHLITQRRTQYILCYIRHIHTQERSRFPSRLKYRDILRLFRQAEISRYSPSGIILLTKLRMPDIKPEYNPCPCRAKNTKIICSRERSWHIPHDANNRANSQMIARFIAICSAMLIAIISEIFYVHTCKNLKISIARAKTEICIPLIPASVNAP